MIKGEDTMNGNIFEGLRRLNIDSEMGLKYCGDEEFYIEVLNIFKDSFQERKNIINKSLETIDIKTFTIQVHSLKSNSANIGAITLSDKAKKLEDAGKNEDFEYILQNISSFMKEYKELVEGLNQLLGFNDVEEYVMGNKEITDEIWERSLNQLKYLLDELEVDDATKLVHELLAYKLEEERLSGIIQIKKLLEHFSVEQSKVILDKIMCDKSVS